MKPIYLDTSAYMKEFTREKGSDTIARLFNLCERGQIKIFTSEWTINESIAAIDRKFRRNEITLDGRDESIHALLRKTRELSLTTNLVLIRVESNVLRPSISLITEQHLSADDSLQLFSAMITAVDVFASADSRLNEAASSKGIQSFNVEEEKEVAALLSLLGFL